MGSTRLDHLAGYSCFDACEPVGEIRVYGPAASSSLTLHSDDHPAFARIGS